MPVLEKKKTTKARKESEIKNSRKAYQNNTVFDTQISEGEKYSIYFILQDIKSDVRELDNKIRQLDDKTDKKYGELNNKIDSVATNLNNKIDTNFRWTAGFFITILLAIIGLFFKL